MGDSSLFPSEQTWATEIIKYRVSAYSRSDLVVEPDVGIDITPAMGSRRSTMITRMPFSMALARAGLMTSTSMGDMAITSTPLDEIFDDRHLVGEGCVAGNGLRNDLDVEAVIIAVFGGGLEKVGCGLENAGDIRRCPADDDGFLPAVPSKYQRCSQNKQQDCNGLEEPGQFHFASQLRFLRFLEHTKSKEV